MDARARSQAWTRRRAGLLLEHLAIAGGYVLLGWLAVYLRPDNRPVTLWVAGGFALAMLLLRGASRWPAILLGSFIVSYWLSVWRWVPEAGAARATSHVFAAAALIGAARTLSTVVGVWLIRRYAGTMRWPHTLGGVLGFIVIAALVHPALAALSTYSVRLSWGLFAHGHVFLQETWMWFNANSAGNLVVTPLILTLADAPAGRPRRASWEVALLGGLYLAVGAASTLLGLLLHMGTNASYLTAPLMIWATLRFGARGAAVNNLVWAAVLIAASLGLEPGESLVAHNFLQVQARIVVLSSAVLILAAAIEERQKLQQALEAEHRNLESRVASRTRELARFLALMHSSLEATADGLLVVDRGGHIIAMNQRFAEQWRLPPSILESGDDGQALAFVLEQLVDPQAFRARVEYLYAHPELESEDELVLKDGRTFERFSRPHRLDEEIVGRVWSFRDVTFRRRAEAERGRLLADEHRARRETEQAFREAQKALGLRDEFLAVAAHEMKTPLTSMKMQIQRLERMLDGVACEPAEAARLRAGVAAALRPMRRFQELSDELLDITRFSSGGTEPRYEPLDFREVVAEQLQRQSEAAEKARSELRLECADPIPGESDRQGLERIVCHLLANGLKFGAGSPLTVRLAADADLVRLQVTDHGIGIAPEDQARIFERLERAADSRHYGGLGLGLWLVRQSAEALGGRVTVESALGQGATFTVELPRTRPPPSMREDTPPPAYFTE